MRHGFARVTYRASPVTDKQGGSVTQVSDMPRLIAAEGGYQEFVLAGGEWAILAFSALAALLAIAVGFQLAKGVLAADQGTPKMIEIAAQKVRFFTEYAGCFIFIAPTYCPPEGVAHILTKFSF